MLGNTLSLPHLLLIALVVLVLFGKGKVSSLMGEVGKGMTAFKRGLHEPETETPAVTAQPETPAAQPATGEKQA